jgi:hypothetical protein
VEAIAASVRARARHARSGLKVESFDSVVIVVERLEAAEATQEADEAA